MGSSARVFAVAAILAGGCLRANDAFHCTSDTDCARGGGGGTCEPVGYCSFADGTCASGARFGTLSGAYANQCVAPLDAGVVADAATQGPDAATVPWLAGYSHRKRITISPTGTTDLVDFPVSVFEDLDSDVALAARGDGLDLVFTAGDGTSVLASELVAYHSNGGGINAFVLTTLSASVPTILYMYFGGPPGTTSGSIWSPMFAGVWHMNGSSTTATDSSGSGHDASAPTTGQAPSIVSGVLGVGRAYDGIDDSLSAGDPADGSLDFGTSSFGYSVWVLVTSSVGLYDMPLNKGGSSPQTAGYDFELGTGVWHSGTADGTTIAIGAHGQESQYLGAWTQLTTVVDRSAKQVFSYVNGIPSGATDASALGSVDNAAPLTLGKDTVPFHGVLDEVRIYRFAPTASWIAAEYQNLAARPAFLTIGSTETP